MKSKRFFISVVAGAIVLGVFFFFFFFFFGFVKPRFHSAVRDVNPVQVAVVQRGAVAVVNGVKVPNVSVVVDAVSVV